GDMNRSDQGFRRNANSKSPLYSRYGSSTSGPQLAEPSPCCRWSRWTVMKSCRARSVVCLAASRFSGVWKLAPKSNDGCPKTIKPFPRGLANEAQYTPCRLPLSWGGDGGRAHLADQSHPAPRRIRVPAVRIGCARPESVPGDFIEGIRPFHPQADARKRRGRRAPDLAPDADNQIAPGIQRVRI